MPVFTEAERFLISKYLSSLNSAFLSRDDNGFMVAASILCGYIQSRGRKGWTYSERIERVKIEEEK